MHIKQIRWTNPSIRKNKCIGLNTKLVKQFKTNWVVLIPQFVLEKTNLFLIRNKSVKTNPLRTNARVKQIDHKEKKTNLFYKKDKFVFEESRFVFLKSNLGFNSANL